MGQERNEAAAWIDRAVGRRALLLGVIMAGTGVFAPARGQTPPATAAVPPPSKADQELFEQTYKLGSGDTIRIAVYNEPDLSGDFLVDGRGAISLPLIGEVVTNSATVRELEQVVTKRYGDGFLRSPQVSVQVINYRPFFILGEVRTPGSYPYVNGMRLVTAVAIAGGYTPRAQTRRMVVVRAGGGASREIEAAEDTLIYPGDTIRIPERFF